MTRIIAKSAIIGILIALITSMLVFLWIQYHVNPYQGRIVHEKTHNKQLYNYFIDLDNNSQKERIQFQDYSNLGRPMVKVRNPDNRNYLGIWNLDGEMLKSAPLLFADYDLNDHKEIYAFARSQDSIFIYGIDYRKENQYLLEKMFVARTRFFDNKIDIEIKAIGEEDLNDDGYDELYFAIDAGFSMRPRRIYAVDVKNRRIHSSPLAGVRFKRRGLQMTDINNDGAKEILASTHASDNYRDTSTFPYNDNSSWLMVFNKNLEFLFEPLEVAGSPGSLRVFPYHKEQTTYLAALHQTHDKGEKDPSSLMLFSTDGKQLRKTNLLDISGIDHSTYFANFIGRNNWKDLIILTHEGQVMYFNEKLQMIRAKQLPVEKIFYSNYIELDSDKKGRELFIPNYQGFLITDSSFDNILQVKGMENSIGIYNVFFHRQDGKKMLYIQDGRKSYEMVISPNWPYAARWWLAAGTFILVIFGFSLQRWHAKRKKIRFINRKLRYQEAEKQRLAKELHDELGNRLMGLRLQMEEMKNEENREKLDQAIGYIHTTHQEIRNIIHNLTPPRFKEYNLISLLRELLDEYDHYSALKVHFQVINDDKPEGSVPDQVKFHTYRILQEAMTNAIKHSSADQAWIRLERNKNHLFLDIEDNGKGFDKYLIESQEKGLGLENMKLRAELLNGTMTIKTNQKGTLLRIHLPLHQAV